jgi:hypothetical protein
VEEQNRLDEVPSQLLERCQLPKQLQMVGVRGDAKLGKHPPRYPKGRDDDEEIIGPVGQSRTVEKPCAKQFAHTSANTTFVADSASIRASDDCVSFLRN